MSPSPPVKLERIDHLVLTVRDLAASRAFYTELLGMRAVEAPGRPLALHFGEQKLHLHPADGAFAPKARQPTPGSGDLCLIAATPIARLAEALEARGVPVELGPVRREGATGPIESIYFRDPDGNLIEVSNPAR